MDRGIKSYVLRAGRFTGAQRRAYENLSGRFVVPLEKNADGSLRVPAPGEGLLDLKALFGSEHPVSAEIGFGMGTVTALLAEKNPHKNYLGIEVHKPGIGRLLWEIEQRGLSNIRIIEHDAVEVFETLIPPASLDAVHLFFPDPWPKKRHHKRRLVTRPFTETLAGKLKAGAYLYMVTDWADYGDWALAELSAAAGLANAYAGFAPAQDWRPETEFERKGRAKNHEVRELFFIRSGGAE